LVDTFAGLGVFTGESDAIDVNGVSLSLGVSIGYAW
jgi:hypothetical protein